MGAVNDDDVKRLTDAIAAAQLETRQHIDTSLDKFRQENAAEFAKARQENAAEFAKVRQENAAEFAKVRQENVALQEETRRHFDIALEGAKHETQLLAEAVDIRFKGVDERLGHIEDSIQRTAAETQAMFKFSHAELDRRMSALEDSVADLQARVERLESSTH